MPNSFMQSRSSVSFSLLFSSFQIRSFPRHCHTEWSQIKTNIIWYYLYEESKTKVANELIYKTEIESQVYKTNLWLLGKGLLLLLSRFSHVQLCATPQTASHQAPLSLGFSRQEHWNGLLFPSPMHESESKVTQLCLTLSDHMDCSPPGSSAHGIFQARVLEWGAIAFSMVESRSVFK